LDLEHLQQLCKSTFVFLFFLTKSQKDVSNSLVNLVYKFPKCVYPAPARVSLRARRGLLSPEILRCRLLSRARASLPARAKAHRSISRDKTLLLRDSPLPDSVSRSCSAPSRARIFTERCPFTCWNLQDGHMQRRHGKMPTGPECFAGQGFMLICCSYVILCNIDLVLICFSPTNIL
jgi:hypothetical protein